MAESQPGETNLCSIWINRYEPVAIIGHRSPCPCHERLITAAITARFERIKEKVPVELVEGGVQEDERAAALAAMKRMVLEAADSLTKLIITD